MPVVSCKATLFKVGVHTLAVLPKSASAQFPSRGMVMVAGTINGARFQEALEPDGRGSHWFKADKAMRDAAGANVGDTVLLVIEPTNKWPEPAIPADLATALGADKQARALWMDITPMARWDWIRWIRATSRQETRDHRIEVAFSKLKHGERRPCCFNRTMCTDPSVSHHGVLLDPTQPPK